MKHAKKHVILSYEKYLRLTTAKNSERIPTPTKSEQDLPSLVIKPKTISSTSGDIDANKSKYTPSNPVNPKILTPTPLRKELPPNRTKRAPPPGIPSISKSAQWLEQWKASKKIF